MSTEKKNEAQKTPINLQFVILVFNSSDSKLEFDEFDVIIRLNSLYKFITEGPYQFRTAENNLPSLT